MIYESKPISMEEKGELVHILNDQKMRIAATEVLQEVQAPKNVKNVDCLKLLSDILRFILTLFIHEKTADFEFLTAMLDSAQNIFFVKNNRKMYLTHFLVDHGIWSNLRVWKACIELNISNKIKEANERLK